MANFTPAGIIRLGHVPFDDSYRHVMDFESREAQTAYFSSVCSKAFSNYKYVRMNNAIQIEGNAEEFYTYDYCMYQNANYGDKWFYAFIVGCNYVNESTTQLILELDVMQTWQFDYTLTECFVEREHVSDDSIGEHLNPEPEMPFDTVAKYRYTDEAISEPGRWYTVVQTNATPGLTGLVSTQNPVSGGIYNSVYSGSKYFAWSDGEYGDLNEWLTDMNKCGAAESITSVFMFPKIFCGVPGSDHGLPTDEDAESYKRPVTMPSSLGGDYVPRNNKLFTFPYCYCQVDDNNGHEAQYRYEYWEGENGQRQLSIQSSLDPNATVIVAPQHYNGIDNNVQDAFTFPLQVQCSWTYSAYQNWLAQNMAGNVLNFAVSAASFAIPAAKGISAAAKVAQTAGNISTANKAAHISKTTSRALKAERAGAWRAFDEATSPGNKAAAAAGAYGLASLTAEINRQSHVPNIAKGICSGNTLHANQYLTYNVTQVVIREEWAKILDGFFDMYGYQVDSLKVPNVKGRPSWNYVKTQNASNRGNVPADDMARINSIFDSGVTFWHTADVGNYSLANK